ncbi:DMT family transporter [Martelella endophytica]|uniref:Membrane protein n=1 Tax=Martelella endophytica TaxID=1486262 RepID=A0A0D5LR38_MAREN|nr:DMT family transporter [Martelella endophytica]AJY45813.1 membrane protein [Martelella endophytica]
MRWQAYLLLTITTFLWGGNLTAGKLAVGHVSPMVLNSLRWGIAALVIGLLSLPQVRRDWSTIRSNWLLVFAFGAVGYCAYNAFLYSALKLTSAVNVSIVQAILPLFIVVINFALFRVRSTMLQLVGFLVTLVGVAVVVSQGNLAKLLQLDIHTGDVLSLLAALCYAGYTVALRWKPPLNWRVMVMSFCAGSFVASIPLTIGEAVAGNSILPHDPVGIGVVLYTALFPSLISQAFFIRGVEIIGPNRAGLFINLIPVFGTVLAVLLLDEHFGGFHAVALALAVGGIAIAEFGKPHKA